MRALAAAALTALLLLALTPTGRADDNIYSGADNPVYAMKGGNGYFYVFYRDTSNNIRYQYYDGDYWSTPTVLVSGNVNGDDDFVVGFYGLTYVLILYQQWVSGNNYNVYILKCTVAAPLSCGSPVSINPPGENAVDAQELTLTYNPSPGRWYAGYVYYSTAAGGYEWITFTSTDGSTWSTGSWTWPGSSVPSQPFRFHLTAIPGTSNAFSLIAARYDEGFYRYYCIGTTSCGSSGTIGSKTVNAQAPPIRGIPSTSSGQAEIFTNNQWFRCTSSSCTSGTTGGATWNAPVSLMRDSSNIYMFYMSGNLVKRRTVTSSVGSEITYLVAPSGWSRYGVGVPVEAATPRPVAYLAGPGLYVHTEPTSFTVTIPQTLTASDTVNRRINFLRTITETLTGSDTVSRRINFLRTITETLTGSDTVNRRINFLRTITETLTGSDTVSRRINFLRTITETLTGSDTVSRRINFLRTITESLMASDTAGRLINYVRGVTEMVGLSDYFAGSPSFTIPELVTIFDALSYQLVSQGEGGGGGGGPAAPSEPPSPPTVEIPVEPVPAQPVAFGSAVVAGILLAVFAAVSLRGSRRGAAVWRRRRARARRVWRG
jgi:hypothetical protein